MMPPPAYWSFEAVKILALYGVALACGMLVLRYDVRVNYTRKINHFALFFLPIFLASRFDFERTLTTTTLTGMLVLLSVGLYATPIRTRLPLLPTMFASFDRPEDRPYTLLWLQTQVAAGYAVIIPLVWLFAEQGIAELMLIPILINGIGDGLAEPVGVRFGRHPYRVRALHGDRVYTRTLEGSACVFLTAVATIVLFRASFTSPQFWTLLGAMPVAMTVAEAKSPHTWDTPFLFLTGGLLLLAVTRLV